MAQRGGTGSGRRWVVVRPVLQFAAIGLAAVAIVGFATLVASRRIGEREAITDARTTTLVKAQGLVEPVVTDALATGDPAAVAAVAGVVEHGVLDSSSLVRVKIWTAAGTIVYSDEHRLEGSTYQLGAEELDALQAGVIKAEVSDLTRPENQFEQSFGKLLEVYMPIRTPGGGRLLFEAYYRFDTVSAAGNRIWRSFAPVSIGALVALELLQIPLAWSLARRLRQRQREGEALLRRALAASDIERRRIAADLHDGVVQDLAGVAITLAAAARADEVEARPADVLESAAESVRASITALRTTLIDIHPPDLHEHGLRVSLADLVDSAASPELDVALDAGQLRDPLPAPIVTLLYRAAREALRNVAAHADARAVVVRAGSDSAGAWVEVTDDGAGFDPQIIETRVAEGHFGLRGLEGLVRDAGGTMHVSSRAGSGTTVRVEVPTG
jgi:signal transduction histidine kinase